MLNNKLQIKDGQTLSIVGGPKDLALSVRLVMPEEADAVLVFVTNLAELKEWVQVLVTASRRGAMTWLAYPKAKQLGTDLNRDIIHDLMPSYGLDAVRQIAIDETWSALRFKSLGSK